MRFLQLTVLVLMVSVLASCAGQLRQRRMEKFYENVAIVETNLSGAVVQVFAQQADGTTMPACPAIAFERDETGLYRFVTTAECVATDDETLEQAKLKPLAWFVRVQTDKKLSFVSAKVTSVGYLSDNFAVLESNLGSDCTLKTVPIAQEDPKFGEDLTGAVPVRNDVKLFRGYIVAKRLTPSRNVEFMEVNLDQPIAEKLPLLSRRTLGLAAFPAKGLPNDYLPASKFRIFWQASKSGKYRWYEPLPPLKDEISPDWSMTEPKQPPPNSKPCQRQPVIGTLPLN